MLQTRLRFIFGFILAPRMVGNKATGLALPNSALGKKQWNPVASGEATETHFVAAKGFCTIVETTKHPEHGAILAYPLERLFVKRARLLPVNKKALCRA